jgi:hypothetical protein
MTFRSYCQDVYILKAENFGPSYERPFIDPYWKRKRVVPLMKPIAN